MKGIIIGFVSLALLIAVNVGCTKESGTKESASTGKQVPLETLKQKASYIMGYNQGRNLKMRQLDAELDMDIFLKGFNDSLKGEAQIEEKDMQPIFQEFFKGIRERQDAKRKISGDKNKVEGEKFLKENAGKDGVITTKSGLQYMVMTEGTGKKPMATDTVEVHYLGTLIDGTEFDSSHKRGQPAKFPLNRVISAWTEGVQLMSVGSKYKFFCPADLAYKERGQGPLIGPHAVLIFEVELLGIEPPKGLPRGEKTVPTPAKKEQKK